MDNLETYRDTLDSALNIYKRIVEEEIAMLELKVYERDIQIAQLKATIDLILSKE